MKNNPIYCTIYALFYSLYVHGYLLKQGLFYAFWPSVNSLLKKLHSASLFTSGNDFFNLRHTFTSFCSIVGKQKPGICVM